MNVRRRVRMRLLPSSAALSLLLMSACLFYTHATVSEVRAAVDAQRLLGSSVAEAEAKLRQIELNGHRHLQVGRYDSQQRELWAHLGNAGRDLMSTWSINVVVKFDMTGHAIDIDTHSSSDNPL